ncbi:MAG: hypothetical protein JNL11_17235 [Bdellovibrionaceae bacterium]|nr:hypothetical protein [Pseudobdellovibrionaceae bacterium]
MVVKNNSNYVYGSIVAVFVVISLAGALYFQSIKTKYQSNVENLKNYQALASSKFEKVSNAYVSRNDFLNKLAIASKKNKDIKEISEKLNELSVVVRQRPLNIPKIESLSSLINQKVVAEIIAFNETKKSLLFSQISQIRALEQYDRYIDLARTEFSDWTFEYANKKKALEKNIFFESNVQDIQHFAVDHVIRSANLKK